MRGCTRPESAAKYPWLHYIAETDKRGLSTDPNVLHHGHSSGYQLLGLAYHHGATQIVLIGYDMRVPKGYDGRARVTGADRHYFGEYPKELQHWPSVSVKAGVHFELVEYDRSGRDQGLVELINCSIELQALLLQRGIDIPVVFMTGRATVPRSVQAMKQGAVDFLEKPVDGQTLIEVIRTAVERSRRHLSEKQECLDLGQRFQSLSARERDVFRLVAKGLLNKQIAAELTIAEVTVKLHRARVMEKMQANSLAELIGMTVKMKLPPCSASIR